MEQDINISKAEMVVMRVIWSLGSAKVEDVAKQVSKRQDWTLATIKTLLGRLVKKEILKTEKEGRCFVYLALVTEEEVIGLLAEDLLSKICLTKQSELFSELFELSTLTASDKDRLIAQLEKKECVESVTCSCLDDENCHCMHRTQNNEEMK